MARSTFPAWPGEATAEAERVVAWLRLPAIGLIALGQGLEHPNPQQTGFLVMLALFSAWSAAVLAWVHLRPAGPRLALVATGVDVVAISMLAVLSGGAFSHARLAFFLVPVAVAFRFRPLVTSVAVVVTTGAYVVQALAHPAAGQPEVLAIGARAQVERAVTDRPAHAEVGIALLVAVVVAVAVGAVPVQRAARDRPCEEALRDPDGRRERRRQDHHYRQAGQALSG